MARVWPTFATSARGIVPFNVPEWLRSWWSSFVPAFQPLLLGCYCGERCIGIAPLMMEGPRCWFLGDAEIFDYQDVMVAPGYESRVCQLLLDYLPRLGVRKLDLGALHPQSWVLTNLVPACKQRGYHVEFEAAGVSPRISLPASWEAYLARLSNKRRREMQRLLRRFASSGDGSFTVLERPDEVEGALDCFLTLFVNSRADKAAFMNPTMNSYFRTLARETAATGILRLAVLGLDGKSIASDMAFAVGDTLYVYSASYDRGFQSLSAGLVIKMKTIQWAMEHGFGYYDFLKGNESYKYQFGAVDVPLQHCSIDLASETQS